jgi:hypothetical protein
MVNCEYIINLYNKKYLNGSATKLQTLPVILEGGKNIIDHKNYINNNLNKQNKDEIYLYKFNDGKKYLSIKQHNNKIIEQSDNNNLPILLYHLHGKPKSKDKIIDSILKNTDKIIKENGIDISYDKKKLKKYFKDLDKEVNNKSNNVINQEGGIAIWLLEKTLKKYAPNFISKIFSGILEIIDIALIITTSIPGLHATGTGFILDIIAIIYAFLRFDTIGLIGSIISLVPVIGDILGAVIKVSGKIAQYFKESSKHLVYREKIADIVKGVADGTTILKFKDEFAETVKLGVDYGDEIVEAIRLGSKYGYKARDNVKNAVRTGDTTPLAVKYGKDAVSTSYAISKYGKNVIRAVELGAKYGQDAIISGRTGARYGKEAINAAISATKLVKIEGQEVEEYVRDGKIDNRVNDEELYKFNEVGKIYPGEKEFERYKFNE